MIEFVVWDINVEPLAEKKHHKEEGLIIVFYKVYSLLLF